jgi:ArsR family transcriptional regulator, arsenate/arsenite/antimonite-responsive transcriptional repressor
MRSAGLIAKQEAVNITDSDKSQTQPQTQHQLKTETLAPDHSAEPIADTRLVAEPGLGAEPGAGAGAAVGEESGLGSEAELAADAELAFLAKAIAHPTRLRILRLLARRSTCVCGDIVGELPFAQSTVSEHLRVLKEAGLVRGEIDPPRVCYCVEPPALARLEELVGALRASACCTSEESGGDECHWPSCGGVK